MVRRVNFGGFVFCVKYMGEPEIIYAEGYAFTVRTNILQYEGVILNHTYTFGGKYSDCVYVSYGYRKGTPVSAKLPHLTYEPECSLASNLSRGSGTALLLRTALRYAYNAVPSIPIFEFDDMSNIDCVEKNMAKSPPRKHIQPLNLAYFSIAYHGKTWYEYIFQANMMDVEKYKAYRERVRHLQLPEKKPSFHEFLQLSTPPESQYVFLKELYLSADTYRDFFMRIPETERYQILYPWLGTFMKNFLGTTYSGNNWYIDVRNMNSQKGGSRHTRKQKMDYRIFYFQPTQTL